MKVDILTPIRHGGPQKWGDDLVRALKNEGIEARNIHNFWGIIQRFFYTDADIVHTTLPLFFTFHRKPVILTIHGDYTREKNIGHYLYPLAIKKAKKITVPSEFLKKEIGLDKAIVIHNGIFPEDFKHANNKNKITQLVTVTGFKFPDKAKGVLELLKILEDVKKKTKRQFAFTVVGDGPYLEEIKEKAKQFDVPVNFIGFHPNPKEILEKSDIFVYYSLHDSFGIVLLEAMASSVPIVCNNLAPFNEIIEDNINGLVIKNKSQFVMTLTSMVVNPSLMENLGLNGRLKTVKYFNWNNIVKKFVLLYTPN